MSEEPSKKSNVTFITITSDDESPQVLGLLEKFVVDVTSYAKEGGCVEVHRSTSGLARIHELEVANASQAKHIEALEAELAGREHEPLKPLYTVTAIDVLLVRDENGALLFPPSTLNRGASIPIYREAFIPNRPADELRGFIVPLGETPQKNIALKFTTGRPHPTEVIDPLP